MKYDCDDAGQKMWDPLAVMNAVEGDVLYQLPGSKVWAAQMLEKIRNANKQR